MADIARREQGEVAVREGSLDWQMEIMTHKFKLSPTMCETHKVERRGTGYALVKRAQPIKIYDDGSGPKTLGEPAPSSRSVFGKPSFAEARRGRYNDEGRLTLMNPVGAGLETREVQPVALI